MSNISFSKGKFREFRAAVTFYVGDLDFSVNKGDHVWFDGYVADFGDGQHEKCPKLKAAIRSGWLQEVSGSNTEVKPYRPKMSSVELAPSSPDEEYRTASVQEEENIVGEVEGAEERHEKNMDSWNNNFLVDKNSGQVHAVSADNVEGFFSKKAQSPGAPKATEKAPTKDTLKDVQINDNQMSVVYATDSGDVIGSIDDFANASKAQTRKEQKKAAEQVLDPKVERQRQLRKAQILKSQQRENSENLKSSFQWDMDRHWTKRAKDAVDNYLDRPDLLSQIMEVETKGVIKAINKNLDS